jgi:hypothetical protein
MVSLYIAMFSCDIDCALIILQLNSPIHTVSFGPAIAFLQNQKPAQLSEYGLSDK